MPFIVNQVMISSFPLTLEPRTSMRTSSSKMNWTELLGVCDQWAFILKRLMILLIACVGDCRQNENILLIIIEYVLVQSLCGVLRYSYVSREQSGTLMDLSWVVSGPVGIMCVPWNNNWQWSIVHPGGWAFVSLSHAVVLLMALTCSLWLLFLGWKGWMHFAP